MSEYVSEEEAAAWRASVAARCRARPPPRALQLVLEPLLEPVLEAYSVVLVAEPAVEAVAVEAGAVVEGWVIL